MDDVYARTHTTNRNWWCWSHRDAFGLQVLAWGAEYATNFGRKWLLSPACIMCVCALSYIPHIIIIKNSFQRQPRIFACAPQAAATEY